MTYRILHRMRRGYPRRPAGWFEQDSTCADLQALRNEGGSDEGKVLNLVRGLQKEMDENQEMDENPAAAPWRNARSASSRTWKIARLPAWPQWASSRHWRNAYA